MLSDREALAARIRIRAFRPEDAPALATLHRAAILATPGAYYSLAERESWARGLGPEDYLETEGEEFEVAVDDRDSPVAFSSRKGNSIMALYVHPDWQGKGLGNILLRAVEERIVQAGSRSAKVHAAISATSFYEGHGYVATEHLGHRTRGGMVLATTRLEKVLVGGQVPCSTPQAAGRLPR